MASTIAWRRRVYSTNNPVPTMGLDALQISVLTKASTVSKSVRDITIGPNSSTSSFEGYYADNEISTSSTDSGPHINTSSKKSRDFDLSTIDEPSRSLMKLINELDQTRQTGVRNALKERVLKMEEDSRIRRLELQSRHQYKQRENLAKLLHDEEMILRQQQEEEIRASQRQQQYAQEHKQHAQRITELNERIKEAEKRQKEAEEEERQRLKEKKLFIDKIHQYQIDYRKKYEEVVELAKHCKDRQTFVNKVGNHTLKLKGLSEAMEQLVKQCKVGEVSNLDLQMGASIIAHTGSIVELIREICDTINKQVESDDKQQEERKANATEVNPSDGTEDLSDFVDKDSFEKYIALQQHLQNFENSYETLMKDDRLKQFKFECQKAVNIPVNAISPTSAAHLQDKLVKLSRLISGQPVEVGHSRVSAASHPQGIAFCKNLMAKKFVWQGELTVSSKPEAAFAIAAVMEALWADFPDFGELVLAHFYKECPYLVPIFMPQVEGQSNQDYYKSLGYHYNENGEVEKQDKFLKRMSGIMRLYGAILITRPCRYQQNKTNPHGLAHAWRWISCILNMDPRPDICATLLYEFLVVVGNSMYAHYGKQFQKLLHLICKEYYPKIEKVTPSVSSGPMIRLEAFLQKILKQGQIPPPVGVLPLNFW